MAEPRASSSSRPAVKRTYGSKKTSGDSVNSYKRSILTTTMSSDPPAGLSTSPVPAKPAKSVTTTTKVLQEKQPAGLHSFFKTVSPPKKRVRTSLDQDENKRPSSSSPVRRSSTPSKKTKPPKLEQLFLDPFSKSVATLSCAVCNMSYARTPDDMLLHDKHHKRVVAGCDWVSNADDTIVIEDDIEFQSGQYGRLIMIDAVSKKSGHGAQARRLNELLTTIDVELDASSLTNEQLSRCKVIAFVTRSHKVIAAAVAERISEAYPVVSSDASQSQGLVRFGEDEGAVFCQPDPVPCLIGIHRIWTSSSYRRLNLASRVLSATAARFVYGNPVPPSKYSQDVAFSQPTNAGMALARNWTGSSSFKVFVET